MKKITLLSLTIFIASAAFSQNTEFYKNYGGPQWDLGQSVCQTSDGGYILSGRTSSWGHGGEDAWIIRTNSEGDTLWTDVLGGSLDDYGYTVRIAPNGDYLVSGHTESFGHGDCDGWFFKLDPNGKLIWMTTYGTPMSEITSSFNFTDDGGYILTGYHGTEADSTGKVFLVRADANNDTLWTKYIGTAVSSAGYAVCQTADSGFAFTGYSSDSNYYNMNMILGKTDKNGNLLWLKTYGGDSDDFAYSMQMTTDGGFIMAGYTNSFGAGNDDGYVVRTDANGNTVWAKTYGGSNLDRFNHIEHTFDGGYILSGMTESYGAGGSDVYLVKIDSAGNQQWMQTFGDTANQVNGSVKQCADSGFIIVGSTSNNLQLDEDYNVLLIKTDKFGNMVTGTPGITQNSGYNILPYPNPSSQSTNFNIPDALKNKNISLEIFDISGRQVYSLTNLENESKITIERGSLPAGTYLYRFADSEKTVSAGKMVLQN